MSDKKRRSRVQGGWASSSVSQTTKKKDGSTTKKDRSKPGTASSSSSSTQFHFKPTIKIKTKPQDIIIKNDGDHELSTTQYGVSRVLLNKSFIDNDECDWMFEQLKNEIPWKQENIKIKGQHVPQPRLTAWYGDRDYTYSGLTLTPYQFSPLLTILKDKIESFMKQHGIIEVHFNSMLANLYRGEKDSIDWHSDDEETLGLNPVIASLSFGETRSFELRKKGGNQIEDDFEYAQHVKIPLCSGSLLVMAGSTQADWQHRIPKEYHDRAERINLTFRVIF